MDITLLVSSLREVPSYSAPVQELYDREVAVVEVTDDASIRELRLIMEQCETAMTGLISTPVNISVMKTHAKIVKPFISNDDLEDDFI